MRPWYIGFVAILAAGCSKPSRTELMQKNLNDLLRHGGSSAEKCEAARAVVAAKAEEGTVNFVDRGQARTYCIAAENGIELTR